MGIKGPRQMTVILPNFFDSNTYKRREIRPFSHRDGIHERWKTGRVDGLIELHNKTPIWCEGTIGY